LAGFQSVFGAAGGQLLFAESHHGAKGEVQQSLAFTSEPFVPALFTHGNVVDEPAPVEIGRRAQRITAALTDQDLEPADIAQDGCRIDRYDLAVALQGVFAEHFAQPGEGLTQVLLGLRVEVGAPQQRRQLLTRLRPGCGAGQVGQQSRKLLARQIDNASRPGQLEASEQRKTEPWGWCPVFLHSRDLHSDVSPGAAIYALSRSTEEI